MSETEARLIELGRAWLIVNVWGERPDAPQWVTRTPAQSIVRGLARHYPGGLDQFVADYLDQPAYA